MCVRVCACVLVSHRRWRGRGRGRVGHTCLHVVLEGGDVALLLHDDAEGSAQRDVPRALGDDDLGQVALLLHLEAFAPQHTHLVTDRVTDFFFDRLSSDGDLPQGTKGNVSGGSL